MRILIVAAIMLAGCSPRLEPPMKSYRIQPSAWEPKVIRPEPVVTADQGLLPPVIPPLEGTKVYRASDCIGPIVNGICQGAIYFLSPAQSGPRYLPSIFAPMWLIAPIGGSKFVFKMA